MLKGLERTLGYTALSKASINELKALFVVIFGTIITVGYSDQWKQLECVSMQPNWLLAFD